MSCFRAQSNKKGENKSSCFKDTITMKLEFPEHNCDLKAYHGSSCIVKIIDLGTF